MLVLMADIFPTGYFAAARFLKDLNQRDKDEFTTVVIGCGPVGLCAITCALTMVKTVYAIDSVPERLAEAEKLGAIPIALNDSPVEKIKAASGGRGADVVMEVVGHADAFMLAFDMIRPWGQISSIGVHTEPLPLNGLLCYGKNVTMAFGRCPVRSIFEDALEAAGAGAEEVGVPLRQHDELGGCAAGIQGLRGKESAQDCVQDVQR